MASDSPTGQKKELCYNLDQCAAIAKTLGNEHCIIEELDLRSRAMNGPIAVVTFMAMATNKTVKRLLIRYTGATIGLHGEGAAALSVALVTNKSLDALTIWDGSLQTKDIEFIAEAMKRNSTLKSFSLVAPRCCITSFTEMLAVNTTLLSLDFSHWSSLDDDDIVSLSESLKQNISLVELILDEVDVSDTGAAALAEMLKHNQTLKKLILDDNFITSPGVVAIAIGLEENTCLQELNLSFNNLEGEAGLAALVGLRGALIVNSTLQSLHLNGCWLAFDETNPMANALELNHTLKELNLRCNDICGDGVTSLARALEHNTGLRKLDLSRGNVVDESCALAMAKALKRNTTLVELGLADCNLGNHCAMVLIEALKYNRTLTSLRMEKNEDVGEPSTVAFMDVMESNTTLIQHYDFRYCWKVEDPGEPYIAACNRHAALQLCPFVAKSGTWVNIVDNYCSRNVALQYAMRAGDALAAVTDGSTLQWAMTHVLQVLRQHHDLPWVFFRSWHTLLYTMLRKQVHCDGNSVLWIKIRNRLVGTDSDATAVTKATTRK